MTNENKFWDWFKDNNSKYLKLDEIENEAEYEMLLEDFLKHLHEYCEGLYFLIGGDDKKEIIITAEGDAKYFDDVEKLVSKAPLLPGWDIIAFKPPMEGDFVTNYEGAEIDTSTSWFMPLENSSKPKELGLKIYIENYSAADRENFLNAAYEVLDTILGEKINAAQVQYVDIEKLPVDIKEQGLIELSKLLEYVKWKMQGNINYKATH